MTKVLGNKKSSDGGKNFVVVDAAMNDLIRPSFYQAYHHVLPVRKYITCVIKLISSLFLLLIKLCIIIYSARYNSFLKL